jgi:hypothetical protein
MKRLFACAALLLSAISAHAGIISADFRTEGDLPDYGSVGPKVYQRLDASIGAGYELDGSDFLSNDSGWEGGEVWVDLDPLTKVLRLVAKDDLDFQYFRFSLARLSGMSITGISMLSDTLTDTGVAPVLDFSSDALSITYDVEPGSFHFKGSASFQLLTSDAPNPVPEPESLALFGLGAAVLGLASRRKFSGPAKRS